jgi:hypothetical protein
MLNKAQYEKRILHEIRAMPDESLPAVVSLLALLRKEFTVRHTGSEPSQDSISHENTRKLMATSEGRILLPTGRTEYDKLFL